MEGTLVYAGSPADVRPGVHQRIEGTVLPGTLVGTDGEATFVLEGDGRRLPVRALQAPPGAFREGQGAVVEGALDVQGTFVADTVVAQHGNSYRAAQ
ncbi:MAG: cytochrome c maturation protein CcmE [Actinomycetota bacterium]|nr:cytochrome c maturation protein CcmE [Actinomycetota bacterium]